MAGGNTRERMIELERSLGQMPGSFSTVCEEVLHAKESLAGLWKSHDELTHDMGRKFETVAMNFEAAMLRAEDRLQKMEDDLTLLKRASVVGSSSSVDSHAKIKVPDPKAYGGTRSAKELENFLWDIEQYFTAAHIPDGERVSICSMYLSGDAKLWWRTRTEDDAEVGRPRIHTWEALKKELKAQFLPSNTVWRAREALKKLRHEGSVRNYVKEFSSLMLEIKNMSEEDKLFNFVSGLQGWAQAELRRQGVKDLQSALVAAESLSDFKENDSGSSKAKDGSKFAKKKSKDKASDTEHGTEISKANEGSKGNDKQGNDKQQGNDKLKKRGIGCFLCNGPHIAKDCPKKESLASISAEEDKGGSDSDTTIHVRGIRVL